MKKPIILVLAAALALAVWLLTRGGEDSAPGESTQPSAPATTRPGEPTQDPSREPATADPSAPTPTNGPAETPAQNGAGDPMLEGETHPSAAPTPSGFTWPEPAPGHTPASPDAAPRGMPDLQKAARDPRALSKAFTQAMFTQDTATDATEHAAVERACEVCTPQLSTSLSAGAGLKPSAEWLQLVEADGWQTAELEENTDRAAEPNDPTTEQWFSWIVTPHPHGIKKDPDEATPITYVRVVDPDRDGTWEVDSYQLR